MYCPECGHSNPDNNRFCGMCGEPLPERRAKTPTVHSSPDAVDRAREEQRARVAQHDPEPVPAAFRHREPVDETVHEALRERASRYESSQRPSPIEPAAPPPPEPVVYAAEPHVEPATPVEEPAGMLSGPSFLGLSGDGEADSGYSYLYEDEPTGSRAPLILLLLVLAALGGVLYWQWQPLRNFALQNMSRHTASPQAAQAPAAPANSTAQNDNVGATPAPAASAAQPADTQSVPQQDNAANPAGPTINVAPQKNAAPAKDNNAAGDTANAAPANDDSAAADTAKGQDEDAGATAAPAVKKKARPKKREESKNVAPSARPAPAQPAGEDLVASGERNLYGRGAPRNCQQAVIDFRAAAKVENPRAMAHLGSLYATGECVPLNRVQAYHWFSQALAKDRSNTYLEHNLSMLWREMDASEKTQVTQRTTADKMF